ncbi:DUF6035 family protein [Providencia rettgeri]|uniref:DUF6035 family protein n=1 Tax=Providencia rettgeri TaxID=587 RepID=UPI0025A6F2BB|nr:DUF6035 family protein [Providencia rettgeri]ELR5222514.1 hypothetical protein [Providencia rettgeri]MDX7324390.1 DUF6035 family protein [Providencia rettgeri]
MKRNMTSVFLTEESRHIDANEFLDNADQETIFLFRRKLEENRTSNPIALCSECFQPVVLRANIYRTIFFSHTNKSEDCPVKTTTNLTSDEILALKYNGQKEGKKHKENKKLLANLLKFDPFFSDKVYVESTFRETNPYGIAKRWRRPDITTSIYSENREQSIVFELQVSTTFIQVIVDRENFYKENNTYIMWIFLEFDCEQFTQLDISYANKSNAFVFDEEARNLSIKNKKVIMKCYYRKPYMTKNLSIDYTWEHQLVNFDELSFDFINKKIYFSDPVFMINQINDEIIAEKQKIEKDKIEREKRAAAMRGDLWKRRSYSEVYSEEEQQKRTTSNRDIITYPSKRNKANLNLSSSYSHKSFGDAVKCPHCKKLVKKKKIRKSLLCNECLQPLE